jgi:hypothetical protein
MCNSLVTGLNPTLESSIGKSLPDKDLVSVYILLAIDNTHLASREGFGFSFEKSTSARGSSAMVPC